MTPLLRAAALFVALGATAAGAYGQSAEQRVAERLKALQQEAEQLASREKTILAELRKLEIERQLRTGELAAIQADLARTKAQLTETSTRAQALRERAEHDRPDVEARLVRIYKMGRAGYWRLLLDADDMQAIGRAYRTAAAMTRLDGERVKQYQQTLAQLTREHRELEARAREIAALQQKAAAARAAAERAVTARTALLQSIADRQDLAARLTQELEAAQQRLQAAVGQPGGRTVATLPLEPFRGDLPWPADGIVMSRFGRQPPVKGVAVVRNGIELSLAEGRPVTAIHEGVVSFAGPFTGYGTLVIVDHGDGAYSLYGHLDSAAVKAGDRVTPQTRVGMSGRNPGGNPALYFELRVDGKPVDPLQWLRTP
jgi:septal ring factor EnvC (AmiA/AmiB activator)